MPEMKITGVSLGDTPDLVTQAERTIRDLAGTVRSQIANRRDHPAYGYTKAMIKESHDRMDGAIGLYMVLTLQASHAGVANLAEFRDPETHEAVGAARRLVKEGKY